MKGVLGGRRAAGEVARLRANGNAAQEGRRGAILADDEECPLLGR
jgi:hypothetical protein